MFPSGRQPAQCAEANFTAAAICPIKPNKLLETLHFNHAYNNSRTLNFIHTENTLIICPSVMLNIVTHTKIRI
jgi:hypothetical protein